MENFTKQEIEIPQTLPLESKNVLFVGGGRRVELAKRFIERGYTIFSYETSHNVPISSVSTILLGLMWGDPGVIYDIINKADTYHCKLIVPLQDAAVGLCARLRDMLPDKVVLSGGIDSAESCYDKKKFEQLMLANFNSFYPGDKGSFPKIIKPRFGFGSRGIAVVFNQKEEDVFFSNQEDKNEFVVQEFVIGKEFSVDCYFDKKSKWIESIPRERIRVSGGEVMTSKTVRNNDLILLTAAVGSVLHIVGPTNMQFIIPANSEVPKITEVNARFGGGYTLSMEAGLDAISLIERDYFGKEFEYHSGDWKENLLLERSYRDHFFVDNSNE